MFNICFSIYAEGLAKTSSPSDAGLNLLQSHQISDINFCFMWIEKLSRDGRNCLQFLSFSFSWAGAFSCHNFQNSYIWFPLLF